MEKIFEELEELGIENDFTKSLKRQFQDYNKLSEKQIGCLRKQINEYVEIKELFEELDLLKITMTNLYNSLKGHFENKKFLTPKQCHLLRIIKDTSKMDV